MASDPIRIEGLDTLIKDLQKFGDDAMPALKTASDTAGERVLGRTRAKVPVLTGNLKLRLVLKTKALKPGDPYTSCQVTFGQGAAYGVPLELGHRLVVHGRMYGKVEPKPFLRPAADESREEVAELVTKAMDRELERLGDKK